MEFKSRVRKPVTDWELANDTASRYFTWKEATEYMQLSVHSVHVMEPTFHDIGVVVGVLHMNEEVEVVVKFHDHIKQLTKRELLTQYVKESFPGI
ncbi:MAG: hypothetical protein JJU03_12595 [Idiomarina sp.]|nr:hypothetical protein [Idiomarina sp.]